MLTCKFEFGLTFNKDSGYCLSFKVHSKDFGIEGFEALISERIEIAIRKEMDEIEKENGILFENNSNDYELSNLNKFK